MILPIRVAIVANSKEIRISLRKFLEQNADIVVVGEAETENEFTELAKKLPIDVALVDPQLPIIEGITASYQIDKINIPYLKIVLVSMHNDMEYLMTMIETKAMRNLQSKSNYTSLEKAIRSVAENKHYYGNPYCNYNYALN